MKKYLFFILAGVLAITSCNKEIQTETVEPEDGPEAQTGLIPLTFKASLEDLGTKSDIADNFILWESSDKIAIFDGTDTFKKFTVSELSPSGKGAEFSGSAAVSDTYVAVAPFSAASTIKADLQRFSITVHGSQTIIGSHSVDPESLVSTAVATGTSDLAFENQFALLKVKLEKNGIVAVTVKGNNGESISGTNHFYYGGEGAPRMDLTNAGGKQVTLTYKASATASPSAFPAGEYYITIWPTEFTGGYSVILTDEDGGKSIKTNSNPQTIARNGGQDLSTIDDFTFCPSVITTAAHLKMWRRLASTGVYAEGDEVKLGADIDLGGYAWTPVPEFLGIFNGQGHKIYNFTVSSDAANVGFIGTLGSSNGEEAVLKDVVFGSSDGTSYDGSSSIEITGDRSGWTYGGIIGYAHKKTTISGVKNFAPVSAASSVGGKHAIGGISGSGNGGSGAGITIVNCRNYGAVTDNAACATGDNSAIGGILGATDGSNTTVSGCLNYAEVHNYCVGVSRLGGIVGKAWDAHTTIDGCSNEGDIVQEAASITDKTSSWDNTVSVGGVLGAFTASGGSLLVNKCSNSGKVYFKSSPNGSYRQAYGGVVGAVTYQGAIKGCSNSGKIYDDATCESHIAMGGILGVCNTKNLVITKADDDTPNTNYGEVFHYKAHSECDTYIGGIVGLENSITTPVEYSINNGRLISDPKGQGTANYYTGGICGSSSGVIRHCTNNGYIFTWAGSLTTWIGGISGGKGSPQEISDCTNNGWLSPYNTSGSSVCGGILPILSPNTTTVNNCINTGMITTGNFYSGSSGNTPNSTLAKFQSKNYYMGGLFGYVNEPTENVTIAEGCIVACSFGQRTGSENKDNFKGIICGQAKSTSSTDYKVTFGSATSPVLVVNTTNFQYGTDATPAVITQGDVVTTTALANKWLMGSSSSLYNAINGSSDTGKVEFHYSIVSSAQAGIE
ncbi:MAG: hypothetical protein IJP39_10800 [Bacteroidales bacterium]|nr:hypothetical protein [Bacteroidales bacterium]